jgi:hypothetical protein
VFDNMLEAIAANKYRVLFNNYTTLECFSNSLHVEGASSSTPLTQDHSNNPFEVQRQSRGGTKAI